MADRRSTPDILGDLLGGSPPPSSQLKLQERDRSKIPAKQSKGIPEIPRDADSGEVDTNYFETLLEHAASALVLVAEVLGHQKLVDWLEEMREVFATDETVTTRKAP
ncbi:MAG: hypothetical protein GY852_09630, partial [bacterium]|nr:hypothetical protein [bacterium]